ncbi:hypothetical protein BJX66DRAFT_319944 [Aspergillus keveii]|uniref:Uncharacterized protein n=1 Tax=Aspergillus keveii TaxID=714993 RepID=A0ABR4FHM7_9EURO
MSGPSHVVKQVWATLVRTYANVLLVFGPLPLATPSAFLNPALDLYRRGRSRDVIYLVTDFLPIVRTYIYYVQYPRD